MNKRLEPCEYNKVENFPLQLGEEVKIEDLISILQKYMEEGFDRIEVNMEYYKRDFYLNWITIKE